jgi:hypothetical protein
MNRNSRMKLISGLLIASAAMMLVFSPSMAFAQDVAVGQATATVLTALTVTAPQDLQFGDVLQGVPNAVAKTTDLAGGVGAGIFRISGSAANEVTAYMQLPDYISLADGSDRMVISFAVDDCNYNDAAAATPSTAGATSCDPHNIPTLTLSAAGDMALFLGGTVYPTVDQTAGAYAGDVVLTVAYNGN